MVKRYLLRYKGHTNDLKVEESANGAYVMHEDYEKLRKENEALRAGITPTEIPEPSSEFLKNIQRPIVAWLFCPYCARTIPLYGDQCWTATHCEHELSDGKGSLKIKYEHISRFRLEVSDVGRARS